MERKEFIKRSIMAVTTVPFIGLVSNCGGDDPTPAMPSEPNCIENGTTAAIGSNHGHTLSIPKSMIENGGPASFQIQGDSGHGHTVIINADQMAQLQRNERITIESTVGNGHVHSLSIGCRS